MLHSAATDPHIQNLPSRQRQAPPSQQMAQEALLHAWTEAAKPLGRLRARCRHASAAEPLQQASRQILQTLLPASQRGVGTTTNWLQSPDSSASTGAAPVNFRCATQSGAAQLQQRSSSLRSCYSVQGSCEGSGLYCTHAGCRCAAPSLPPHAWPRPFCHYREASVAEILQLMLGTL